MNPADGQGALALVFSDTAAAHAFLDIAEQAPDGTVYLRGVELAQDALARLDDALAAAAQPSALAEARDARDHLRNRIAALIAAVVRPNDTGP